MESNENNYKRAHEVEMAMYHLTKEKEWYRNEEWIKLNEERKNLYREIFRIEQEKKT